MIKKFLRTVLISPYQLEFDHLTTKWLSVMDSFSEDSDSKMTARIEPKYLNTSCWYSFLCFLLHYGEKIMA